MRKIICTLLALLMVLTVLPLSQPVHAVESEPEAAKAGSKLVAITFDDGPGEYTSYLIDELNKLDCKATFFVLGNRVSTYPKTLEKAYLTGHEIGCHTWNHPELTSLDNDEILSQFSRSYDAMNKILGKGTYYLTRAPYDSTSPRVRNLINTPFIIWAVDPQDWDVLNREKVCSRIVHNTDPGDIILVHDIYRSSVYGALDAIKQLKKEGYEFVTVKELFRRQGKPLEAHHEYYSCKPTGKDLGRITKPAVKCVYNEKGILVSLSAQKGADIYFNITGAPIKQGARKYTGPFYVQEGTTVYATAAYDLNGSRSDLLTKKITRNDCVKTDNLHPYPSDYRPRYYSPSGKIFADVFPRDWYCSMMDEAAQKGIIQGTKYNYYKPMEKISRAEFVSMLYKAAGSPKVSSSVKLTFKDVPRGADYETALKWAFSKKLILGYSASEFGPNGAVSREQACVILDRYLNCIGKPLADGNGSMERFDDDQRVQKYARHAVDSMVRAGLIKGNHKNMLLPADSATRAEYVTMFLRVLAYQK